MWRLFRNTASTFSSVPRFGIRFPCFRTSHLPNVRCVEVFAIIQDLDKYLPFFKRFCQDYRSSDPPILEPRKHVNQELIFRIVIKLDDMLVVVRILRHHLLQRFNINGFLIGRRYCNQVQWYMYLVHRLECMHSLRKMAGAPQRCEGQKFLPPPSWAFERPWHIYNQKRRVWLHRFLYCRKKTNSAHFKLIQSTALAYTSSGVTGRT